MRNAQPILEEVKREWRSVDEIARAVAEKFGCDVDEVREGVEAVAGAGESLETSDAIGGLYAFRREFFDRLGLHAKRCVMMV